MSRDLRWCGRQLVLSHTSGGSWPTCISQLPTSSWGINPVEEPEGTGACWRGPCSWSQSREPMRDGEWIWPIQLVTTELGVETTSACIKPSAISRCLCPYFCHLAVTLCIVSILREGPLFIYFFNHLYKWCHPEHTKTSSLLTEWINGWRGSFTDKLENTWGQYKQSERNSMYCNNSLI